MEVQGGHLVNNSFKQPDRCRVTSKVGPFFSYEMQTLTGISEPFVGGVIAVEFLDSYGDSTICFYSTTQIETTKGVIDRCYITQYFPSDKSYISDISYTNESGEYLLVLHREDWKLWGAPLDSKVYIFGRNKGMTYV